MGKRESLILLFDLDDTLVPSTKAYEFALSAIELAPDDAFFLRARAEVKRICPMGYPAARSRRLYFKRYLELRGLYTPTSHLRMVQRYEEAVCSYIENSWHRLDRPALFERLRKKAEVIGIVTNETTTFQSAKLSVLDPHWNYFDFVITSEEVGIEKPHLAVFNRALEVSGLGSDRPKTDCIFVGDNYDFDIAPAVQLGMRAVQTMEFLTSDQRHLKVINHLQDLEATL